MPNEREWLFNRFQTNLDLSNVKSTLYFGLLWNLFEGGVCNQNFDIQLVRTKISLNNMVPADFSQEFAYFKARYITNGNSNQRFNELNLRSGPNGSRELVKNVLTEVNTNSEDIIASLILIVNRYRNNMYHGIKDVSRILEQEENFSNANSVIVKFLDRCIV